MKSKRNWRGASIIMAATAVVALAVAFAGIASASTLTLPDPTIYDPVAYGDSLVYSLELQNLIQNNNKLNPNSQFNVSSIGARIWAGIHTRTADEHAHMIGEKVAEFAFANFLKPVASD